MLERYRGTLLGSAVGDALGAPVEFLRWEEIASRYGPQGIQGLIPSPYGFGAVTDDTQMTLATAKGLLAAGEAVLRGDHDSAARSVYSAYLEWLSTQEDPRCRRAPGFTCLSALRSGRMGTVESPLNDSKGSGGVMRASPAGLSLPGKPDDAFSLGVRIAAITHGHPLGYIPAGVLAALISRLIARQDLAGAVQAEASRPKLDPGTRALLMRAFHLALYDDLSPLGAVEALGQGWTGDEPLAIAVYCSLRFAGSDAFRKAVLASINHSGDSDSTGAITGAIMGAWLGEDAVPKEWLSRLEGAAELSDVAFRMWLGFGVARKRR